MEASTIQDAGTAGFALPSLSRFESVARLLACSLAQAPRSCRGLLPLWQIILRCHGINDCLEWETDCNGQGTVLGLSAILSPRKIARALRKEVIDEAS